MSDGISSIFCPDCGNSVTWKLGVFVSSSKILLITRCNVCYNAGDHRSLTGCVLIPVKYGLDAILSGAIYMKERG